MRFAAQFLSSILHPLLMPLLIFSFIVLFLPEMILPIQPSMFGPLLLLIAISTLVAPCILVLILFKLRVVSTANIADRNDRYIPQVLATVLYASTTWFFYDRLPIVGTLYTLMGSMTVCMGCVTVTNFFWKISAHSTAMGGLCAFVLFISGGIPLPSFYLLCIVCLLVAGSVMAARLYLQVHTLAQVCSGFVLGLLVATLGVSNIS